MDESSPDDPITPARSLSLRSGGHVALIDQGAEERLEIRARDGSCMLAVRLTDAGPVLSLSGASLEISATERIDLSCDSFQLRSREANIKIDGDLQEQVGGEVVRRAEGDARLSARNLRCEADGDVSLLANDDVRASGERVLLNSDEPPLPLSLEEYRARRQSSD